MNSRNRYKRKRQLRQSGISVETGSIGLHNQNESLKHFVLKTLVALKLQQAGRVWGTAIDVGRDVVDVLDWGDSDGKAVIHEIESDCTP